MPLLAYSQASGLGRILAAHQAGNDETLKLETVFTSHLAATLMTMAREGHGLAWLPLTWPKRISHGAVWCAPRPKASTSRSRSGFSDPPIAATMLPTSYGSASGLRRRDQPAKLGHRQQRAASRQKFHRAATLPESPCKYSPLS